MATQHDEGYLVLADISGFTPYLAGVELEHARDILTELLELIVGRFRPLLALAKIEGDAVLAYTAENRVKRGETLLEVLEATYVAFRERVEQMGRNSSCRCQACLTVTQLDLKFLAHYGEYLAHQLAGEFELIGLDVMLVRERWLKSPVGELTGWRGYALFTEMCLGRMGMAADGMMPLSERYEALGRLQTYCLNLQERYDARLAARHHFLALEDADASVVFDFDMPPAVVWEWLNDPGKRSRWIHGTSWSAGLRPQGRTGPGASNHCDHGSGRATETVLDWRPFDYYTVEVSERRGTIIQTVQLQATAGGSSTRLHHYFQFQLPLPRWLVRRLGSPILRSLNTKQSYQVMARMMAEENALASGNGAEA
jgi:hypothetical protein